MTTRHNDRHAPSSPVLAEVSISDFIGRALSNKVRVASPDAFELRGLFVRDGVTITSDKAGRFVVDGLDASEIGENAAAHGARRTAARAHRLVEHHHRRISRQCRGDPEPLAHASENDPAGFRATSVSPTGPRTSSPAGRRRRRSGRERGGGCGTDDPCRPPSRRAAPPTQREAPVTLCNRDPSPALPPASVGRGRGPPAWLSTFGSVGSEEACDDPWSDGEAEVVDGGDIAIALGEQVDLEHDVLPWKSWGLAVSPPDLVPLLSRHPVRDRVLQVRAPWTAAGAVRRLVRRSRRRRDARTHSGCVVHLSVTLSDAGGRT